MKIAIQWSQIRDLSARFSDITIMYTMLFPLTSLPLISPVTSQQDLSTFLTNWQAWRRNFHWFTNTHWRFLPACCPGQSPSDPWTKLQLPYKVSPSHTLPWTSQSLQIGAPVKPVGSWTLISQLALLKGSCPHPQLRKAAEASLVPSLCIHISRKGFGGWRSTDLTGNLRSQELLMGPP